MWERALKGLAEGCHLRVVGTARSAAHALELVKKLRPGVFIAELDSSGGVNDLDLVVAAKQLDRELRVIVISKERGRKAMLSAFSGGVSLYVLHDAKPEDVAAGMRQLFDQSVFIAADWSSSFPRSLQTGGRVPPMLTRREYEILQLVAHGHRNGTIASMLAVTEQTIKFHLSNVYRKLGVSNRTEAARWAQMHGLVPLALPDEPVEVA
jgi:DNA-binding NarL/FixJ family response regulator